MAVMIGARFRAKVLAVAAGLTSDRGGLIMITEDTAGAERGRTYCTDPDHADGSLREERRPVSDAGRAARTVARWRQAAEQAQIPRDQRERLIGLLAAGDGASTDAAAEVLGVARWTARIYLERLRYEGIARLEGTGRAARWCPVLPGEGQ
jgi:hypothetical protein